MSYFITAIVFILIFSVLILIHELGHFVMAKRAGIKVEEFGFGLPPRIWGKKKGETLYSINLIPFGGFVRMLGEDSRDAKMLKDKRSFIAQPMRNRVKVIVAGVTMNFLLAYILLTVALIFGMEPLLMPDDILPKTASGVIEIKEGVLIKSANDLATNYGIKNDDRIFKINGKELNSSNVSGLLENDFENITIRRGDANITIGFDDTKPENAKNLDLSFYGFTSYPRVKILGTVLDGNYASAGLLNGDIILRINDENVFTVDDFRNKVSGLSAFDLLVSRNGREINLKVKTNENKSVIVSSPLPASSAEKAGIISGDIILEVNGLEVSDSASLISAISENKNDELKLIIVRDGNRIEKSVTPENGKIGVLLSDLFVLDNLSGISLYTGDDLTSIIKIQKERYPIYLAPIRAFEECYKLSKVTAVMFTGFVKSFVSSGQVPEGVSGPVGIAQMTHFFVKDGFIAILRFMALLSLSLAVINILPIPALDGGRLLFIFIELIIGKKVNQKWESYIHGLGYLLVLGLIIAVTYSDIVNLIKS